MLAVTTVKLQRTNNMKFKSILITGCDMGIGLEYVRQLSETKPSVKVFAACLNPDNAKEIQEIAAKNKNVYVLKFDVTDSKKFDAVVKEVEDVVGEDGLNVLYNNAGLQGFLNLDNVTEEVMMQIYRVNTIAPLMVSKAFLPLLKKAAAKGDTACIISAGTKLGSITHTWGQMYPYRASKAALHMVMKTMAVDIQKDGVGILLLRPGHVKTALGGPTAVLTVTESVQGMLKVIENHDHKNTGAFLDYLGNSMEW